MPPVGVINSICYYYFVYHNVYPKCNFAFTNQTIKYLMEKTVPLELFSSIILHFAFCILNLQEKLWTKNTI